MQRCCSRDRPHRRAVVCVVRVAVRMVKRRRCVHVARELFLHSSTAILSEKYRISSELRSQATAGPVSTTVGDHVGIRGAVGSLFWLSPQVFLAVFPRFKR